MRRSARKQVIAPHVYGLLLLLMAAGQLADPAGFADALRGYAVFRDAAFVFALLLPAAEVLAGAGLLLPGSRRCSAARGAGALGLIVAVFWAALAAQAFARGLALDNCGCFGVYLRQELRWWILLEDVYLVLLASFAARAAFGSRARTSAGQESSSATPSPSPTRFT